MNIEEPSSPSHCLKIFNDNIKTDILKDLHQGIQAKMDPRYRFNPEPDYKQDIELLKTQLESLREISSSHGKLLGVRF